MKTSEEKASAANLPSLKNCATSQRHTGGGGGRRRETQKGGLDGCVRRKWAATGFCFLGRGEAVVPRMERIQSQGNWRETNFEFANLSRQTKRSRMVCLRRETIYFSSLPPNSYNQDKMTQFRLFYQVPSKWAAHPSFVFGVRSGVGPIFISFLSLFFLPSLIPPPFISLSSLSLPRGIDTKGMARLSVSMSKPTTKPTRRPAYFTTIFCSPPPPFSFLWEIVFLLFL